MKGPNCIYESNFVLIETFYNAKYRLELRPHIIPQNRPPCEGLRE